MARLARMLTALPLFAGLLLLVAAGCASAPVDRAGAVVVLPTTGVVDSVMAGYLESGIDKAAADGAAAVMIELEVGRRASRSHLPRHVFVDGRDRPAEIATAAHVVRVRDGRFDVRFM